jgi:hypothetical protein
MRGAIAIRSRTGGPQNPARARFVRARLQSCRKRLKLLPALAAEGRIFLPPPSTTLPRNSKISSRESLQSRNQPPRSNRENGAPFDIKINASPHRPGLKISNRELIRLETRVTGRKLRHRPQSNRENNAPVECLDSLRVGAGVNLPPALALGARPNALQLKNPAPIRTKRKKHPQSLFRLEKNLPFVFFNLRKI